MTFPAAYPIVEVAGSPRFQLGPDGITAQRDFKVAWGDVNQFIVDLTDAGMFPSPALPTNFPGFPNVVVTKIEAEPPKGKPMILSAPDGLSGLPTDGFIEDPRAKHAQYPNPIVRQDGTYDPSGCGATVGVEYIEIQGNNLDSQAGQGVKGETYVTCDWTTGGNFQTLPGRMMYWECNNCLDGDDVTRYTEKLSEDSSPGVFIPRIDYKLTWHFVDEFTFDIVQPLILGISGMINSECLMLPCIPYIFPPGTVLFSGSQNTKELRTDLNNRQRIVYTFSILMPRVAGSNEITSCLDPSELPNCGNGPINVVGWNHIIRDQPEQVKKVLPKFRSAGDNSSEVTLNCGRTCKENVSVTFTPSGIGQLQTVVKISSKAGDPPGDCNDDAARLDAVFNFEWREDEGSEVVVSRMQDTLRQWCPDLDLGGSEMTVDSGSGSATWVLKLAHCCVEIDTFEVEGINQNTGDTEFKDATITPFGCTEQDYDCDGITWARPVTCDGKFMYYETALMPLLFNP